MSTESLRVLSAESVQVLKNSIAHRPSLLDMSFEDLRSELRLVLVPSPYQFNASIELLMPEGSGQDSNRDVENSINALDALPGLTPALATDDRLWVTLSFSTYRAYSLARWPIVAGGAERLQNNIRNHFFASGVRGRMRDNAVSRLWWMGHIASRVDGMDPNTVFDILFANSDYRSNLLERNSTSNATSVLSAILAISHEAYESGLEYKRAAFRSFMSRVDLLGGRCNLASLKVADLVERLRPIYLAAYSASN